MKLINLIISILAILLGGFMIFFGGMDDSPGAQGIGLITVIVGIVILVKSRKKSRS